MEKGSGQKSFTFVILIQQVTNFIVLTYAKREREKEKREREARRKRENG